MKSIYYKSLAILKYQRNIQYKKNIYQLVQLLLNLKKASDQYNTVIKEEDLMIDLIKADLFKHTKTVVLLKRIKQIKSFKPLLKMQINALQTNVTTSKNNIYFQYKTLLAIQEIEARNAQKQTQTTELSKDAFYE